MKYFAEMLVRKKLFVQTHHFTDGETETRSCYLFCQSFTQVVKEVKLESGVPMSMVMCSLILLSRLMEVMKRQAFTVLTRPL